MLGQLLKKRQATESCQLKYRPGYLKFLKIVIIKKTQNLFDYHISKGERTVLTGC